MKVVIWRLTKKYRFLRPLYFYLIKIKNSLSIIKGGYWVPKDVGLKDFFLSIKELDYVLLSKEQANILDKELDYNQDIDLLVNDIDIGFIKKGCKKEDQVSTRSELTFIPQVGCTRSHIME